MSHALIRRVAVTAAALLTPLLPVLASPSASAEDSYVPGDVVRPLWESSLGYLELPGATSSYVMHERQQYREDEPAHRAVVRLSDGETVRQVRRPEGSPTWPTLVDDSYVQLVEPPGAPRRVEVRDVETGELTGTMEIGGQVYVHGDDEWALLTTQHADTDDYSLTVAWPDGRTVAVPGRLRDLPRWAGGDSSAAFVTSGSTAYEVDPATGVVEPVTFPGAPAAASLWAVTPTALYGHLTTYEGEGGESFWVVDRVTGELSARVDVPQDHRLRGLHPYGDGLAAVYLPDGAAPYRYELRPVDMATGALEAAVATDVAAARRTEDGRIVLAIGDVPAGRLAVAADEPEPVQPVTDLPRIAERAMGVGLSGDTVAASWGRPDGVRTTSVDGTEPWDAVHPAIDFHNEREKHFDLGGDVVLAQVNRRDGTDPFKFRLSWPGGGREVEGWRARLGNGGEYLIRGIPDSNSQMEVQEVRTGTAVTSWRDSKRGRVVDEDLLWAAPDANGVMTGTDLTGEQPDQVVEVPDRCDSAPLRDVRGRWALLVCDAYMVVDLMSVVAPYPVPARTERLALGDGFVAWVDHVETERYGDHTILLRVADLSPGHEVRSYGELRGEVFPPGPDFAVDDDGGPEIVYVDPASQVRRVDLSWIGTAPTTRPDRTAPSVEAGPGLADAVASNEQVRVEPTWTYVEDAPAQEPQSGLDTYDVRYRERLPGGGYDDWVEPVGWQGMGEASVGVSLDPGTGRCFAARATDKAGNTSAWSEPSCVYVDATAPTLSPTGGSKRFLQKLVWLVEFRFRAGDDDAVASYDVQRRSAPRGEPLGTWRTVLPATERTSASVEGRPGAQHCFRFRARDRAGIVSGWSPARCTVMPVDDHEFVTRGRAAFRYRNDAIAGTYTRLKEKGAHTTLRGQTGRQVGVWILRGPGQGKADVYTAGRRVGRISFAAARTRRVLVLLPATSRFRGGVRIVQATDRPVNVDAVVVVR